MLVEFSVENYRSIAEKQTLSFVASKQRSDAEGAPAVEHPGFPHRLLTSAVVYGPNASGKSNLFRALMSFKNAIRDSAVPAGRISSNGFEPFRLDIEAANRPTTFELIFIRNGIRHQYGFAVDMEKIVDEWLIVVASRSPQLLFQRTSGAAPKFGKHLRGEKRRIHELTRPDALYLSVAAQLNHEQLGAIHKWLLDHVMVIQAKFVSAALTAELASDSSDADAVASMLKVADLGIEKVLVRRHEKPPEQSRQSEADPKTLVRAKGDDYLEVLTQHRRSDGSLVNFDLMADESDGTFRYFTILAPLFHCLGRGGAIAVDELDDSLHPLLVRRIVSWFHDPQVNKLGAQLLFNTHDTTLLDPSLFRRDQILFTEKDQHGKTRLYSLLEFSPRKTEALQKGYLEGRYGAIPFLGELRFETRPDNEREVGT